MVPAYQHQGSRFLRTLWIGIVALTCLRVWLGPEQTSPAAMAQIPDSALQRKNMVDELRQMNRTLQEIQQTLKTGTLKVRVEGADNTGTDNKRRR